MSALSWEDLTKYDDNPPEDKALPRSTSVQKRYGGYLGALKKKGITIGQDVMDRIIKNHHEQQIIVTKNDFPYNVAADIHHLVVWINPLIYELSSADDAKRDQFARRYVKSLLPHSAEFVMFENLANNKSVATVHHYQLFIKGNDVGMLPVEKL